MKKLFPMKLQLFADGSGSAGSGSGNAGDGSGTTETAGGTNRQTPPAIDYAKMSGMPIYSQQSMDFWI